MGRFIFQLLFEAYFHFMPVRIVLWTMAAIIAAFLLFAAAQAFGLIGR